MKVKMLCRHTHPSGKKLEQGFIYEFPQEYANELIRHGLATMMVEIVKIKEVKIAIEETPIKAPGFAKVSHKKATKFQPKALKG